MSDVEVSPGESITYKCRLRYTKAQVEKLADPSNYSHVRLEVVASEEPWSPDPTKVTIKPEMIEVARDNQEVEFRLSFADDIFSGAPEGTDLVELGLAIVYLDGSRASGSGAEASELQAGGGGPLPGMGRRPAGTVAVHVFNPRISVLRIDGWNPAEIPKVMSALGLLTADRLTLRGAEVFSDGSAGKDSKPVGTKLIRGVQSPAAPVTVRPLTDIIPTFNRVTRDVFLNFSTFHMFEVDAMAGGITTGRVPDQIKLGHELVHAYYNVQGGSLSGSARYQFTDGFGERFNHSVFVEELATCGIQATGVQKRKITENSLRREHGLRPRSAYASPSLPLDAQGVEPPIPPPMWWPNYPF